MSKLRIIPERGNANEMIYEETPPCKVKVCHCAQCKYVKNKRKNRNLKNKLKRLTNKKTRQMKYDGKYFTQYWA